MGRVDIYPYDFPVVWGEPRKDFPVRVVFFKCDGSAGRVLFKPSVYLVGEVFRVQPNTRMLSGGVSVISDLCLHVGAVVVCGVWHIDFSYYAFLVIGGT